MNLLFDSNKKIAGKKLKQTAWALIGCVLFFCAQIPQASAVDNCDVAGIADVLGERVQLKSCASDFDGGNNDSSNDLTFPVGTDIAVGDLLIAHVANDSNNDTFNAPPTGWTQLEAQLGGNDIHSKHSRQRFSICL